MATITNPIKPEIQEWKFYLQYITILKHRKQFYLFWQHLLYWIQGIIEDELRTGICLEEINNLEYSQG